MSQEEEEKSVRKRRGHATYVGKCPPRWRAAQSYNRKRQFAREMHRFTHEGQDARHFKPSTIQSRRRKFYKRGAGSLGIVIKPNRVRKLAKNQIRHLQVKHSSLLRKTKEGEQIKHRFGTGFLDGLVACNETLLNKILSEAARFAKHRHRHKGEKEIGLKLLHEDLEQAYRSIRGF